MTTTWIQKKGKVMLLPYSARRDFTYMEDNNVLKITEDQLPLAVLSSSAASPFAFGIINIRKSIYNHFMWMHKPGMLATQSWCYKEVPLKNYIGFDKRLKFWHNPNWTDKEKQAIKNQIQYWLEKPKWRTAYDSLALVGQALNAVWIQNPLLRICSDYGSILKESGVDTTYDLKHPAPDQVDDWFSNHPQYKVFCRYAAE
jgi:hypothetical protein